jgi:hypothetical protein
MSSDFGQENLTICTANTVKGVNYMAPIALSVLKNALAALQKHVSTRKAAIQAKLTRKEAVSTEDCDWLDNEANVIDEERVLEELEGASDYEGALLGLDTPKKSALKRLKKFSGGVKSSVSVPLTGTKRKRTCI